MENLENISINTILTHVLYSMTPYKDYSMFLNSKMEFNVRKLNSDEYCFIINRHNNTEQDVQCALCYIEELENTSLNQSQLIDYLIGYMSFNQLKKLYNQIEKTNKITLF